MTLSGATFNNYGTITSYGSSGSIIGTSYFYNYGSLSIVSGATMTITAPLVSSGNVAITGTLIVSLYTSGYSQMFNTTGSIYGSGSLQLNAPGYSMGSSGTIYVYSRLTVSSVIIQTPGSIQSITVWVNSNFAPSTYLTIVEVGSPGTPYLQLSGTITIPSGCNVTCGSNCNIEGTGTLVMSPGSTLNFDGTSVITSATIQNWGTMNIYRYVIII